MYYTIEGKRFLCVLYISGLLVGSLLINLSVKMNLFRITDFLGFTEYVKTLEGLDTRAFFSYVCMVRVRQCILFFLCLFLFSPYVVYCVIVFAVSFMVGMLVSSLTAKYGIAGMVQGSVFLFPHYLFYGIMLVLIYVYLFQKTPFSQIYRISSATPFVIDRNKRVLENRIVIVLFCFLLFGVGCYTEAYINPVIVQWVFN